MDSQQHADHAIRGVLRLPAFRRLWLSLGLSSFGDWLGFLAVTAMAASLGAKDSYAAANLAVSGVLILRLAPAVLLGPLAGAFADRFDRKTTMVVGDLLRFVFFASIPLIGTLWWLFIATVITEIIGLFWLPAKDATVPNLVPKERLATANQLSLATTYGSAPFAALLFSGLSLAAGIIDNVAPWVGSAADVAMYANALTNLIAAVVVWRLDLPRRAIGTAGAAEVRVWQAIVQGWSYVAHNRLVRGLVLGMLGAFGAGGFVIGVAPTFTTDLGAGAPAYGLLFAAVFTGLAGGMWVGPRLLPDFTRWRLFALALTTAGLWLCCLAVFPNSVLAVLFTLLLGTSAGVAWVSGYTLLGLEVADEMRGRTFAFVQNGARVVLILVMAIAPGLAALFGERHVRVSKVVLTYNGAAITLLLAGLLAVVIGLLSYRTMNDHPSLSLREDVMQAWRSRPAALPAAPMPAYPGLFVVFEGGDGAGKTSQLTLLEAWLRVDLGRDVVATREPGATALGGTLRQLVLHGHDIDAHAETLLFAADRAQHVHTVIRPALERGAVVVSDRYVDSSIAYQGGGRGFDPAGIERISGWATGNLVPDLTIVLDIDPSVARKRMAAAGMTPDRLEGEGLAFHARVRQMFLARARRAPRRYLVLDATADPLDLSEQVRQRLHSLLMREGGAAGHRQPADSGSAPAAGATAAGVSASSAAAAEAEATRSVTDPASASHAPAAVADSGLSSSPTEVFTTQPPRPAPTREHQPASVPTGHSGAGVPPAEQGAVDPTDGRREPAEPAPAVERVTLLRRPSLHRPTPPKTHQDDPWDPQ